jgi:hypothetical protein
MNCKKILSFDFLTQNCSKTFINGELKKHRENVLLEQQKARIPATLPFLEREKDRLKMEKRIKEIEHENYLLRQEMIRNNNRIYNIRGEFFRTNQLVQPTEEAEKKSFIRKCPITDCRGFLSTKWKCGLCDKYICNKCNEEKHEDELDDEGNHMCKPDNVKTMELLNKDTKPCPNCGTMIFKINGCDQMWCTDCNTAFSWTKGVIERGTVHNPHYYEFLRKQNNGVIPRNPGDNPCEDENVLPYISWCHRITFEPDKSKIHHIYQFVNHIRHTVINTQYPLRTTIANDEEELNLRIKYLMTNMDDNEYKILLQQREKKRMKHNEFRDIYIMYVQTTISRVVLIRNTIMAKTTNFFLDQADHDYFTNLLNYFNESAKDIGKKYSCVYPHIMVRTNGEYSIISNK